MLQEKTVFICGLHQESNSFNPVLTGVEHFRAHGIYEDDECINIETCSDIIRGMCDTLAAEKINIVGGVTMRSGSGGPVESSIVEGFIDKISQKLEKIRPDGVVIDLHGATTSDKSDDVCGDILKAVRDAVGDEIPVSASFDLHANITQKVKDNADYISGFLCYPHIDQYETGVRAAKRMVEHLSGKDLKTVCVSIPMIAPPHGYTTQTPALAEIKKEAEGFIKSGVITDYSIFQVQPWLETENLASTVVIISEDEKKAKELAMDLAKKNYAIRNELFGEPLLSVDEVIEKALENKSGKPVILVDSADSPNAGATGDSAAVLEKMLLYKDKLNCAFAVTDPVAVKKAFEVGIGAKADFVVGATVAPKLTKPVKVEAAIVKSLHDGEFYMHGPQETGRMRNIGKTAVLQAGKVRILICSDGKNEGDLNFYRSFGINPEFCDLVCVKACTSFRAGYEAISGEICNTETPGAAGPVLTAMPFEKRPKPLFPFEELSESDIFTI